MRERAEVYLMERVQIIDVLVPVVLDVLELADAAEVAQKYIGQDRAPSHARYRHVSRESFRSSR